MKTFAEMNGAEKREAHRKRIKAWELAAPVMEQLRREEIRKTNTKSGIAAFDGMLEKAVKDCPPRPYSGLIEQQKILHRDRR